MESTKHLLYNDLCREYRSSNDQRVKKIIDEIANQQALQWTDAEELNLGLIRLFANRNPKAVEEAIAKHGLSLKDVAMKVSIRNMKSRPTSIPCCTL